MAMGRMPRTEATISAHSKMAVLPKVQRLRNAAAIKTPPARAILFLFPKISLCMHVHPFLAILVCSGVIGLVQLSQHVIHRGVAFAHIIGNGVAVRDVTQPGKFSGQIRLFSVRLAELSFYFLKQPAHFVELGMVFPVHPIHNRHVGLQKLEVALLYFLESCHIYPLSLVSCLLWVHFS